VLFAFAGIHRNGFIREAKLFEQQGYFGWVGGGIKVKLDHGKN
jgi:hypothetical protein